MKPSDLLKRVQKNTREFNLELAEGTAEEARRDCPVRTGALKNSIRVEVDKDTGEADVVAGNEQVNYAPYVEYGGVHTPSQPFMTPSAERAKKRRESLARRRNFYK